MKIVLYIIAILWVISGTFLIIYTEQTREFLKKVFLTENTKLLAFLPFVVGLVLVVGAFFNKGMFWLAFIIGLLAMLKGVYFFMAPKQQAKALLEWWFINANPRTVRFFGLITFFIGVTFLSFLG
jgi:uncharacterized protein YjeT (DUF2065 family)